MAAERPALLGPIDGLLIVDKPAGWTSHDVIGRLRRLTGIRRIGHAGTLDPLATGVLPVGIGQGTRVLEYVTDQEKTYDASIHLGVVTDTYDADGAITATTDAGGVTEEAAREALRAFLGEIEQRPPAYSAIKVGGVPLHRLARAGRDVEAPVRRVTITAIDGVALDGSIVTCSVHCSKGTYIRSLAHDLGQRLGCGAHLAALRRTRTGGFGIEQAVTLDGWERAIENGSWPRFILPLDAPLAAMPVLVLDQLEAARLLDGVAPGFSDTPSPGMLARAYDSDGYLLAVIRAGRDGWRAEKVFVGSPAPDQRAV